MLDRGWFDDARILWAALSAAGALFAALAGVLELGAGVSALRGAPPTPGNLALCSFLIGFGSLSVHCQTLAAASRAGLKTARHFAGRLLHGCLAALAAFLLFTLLRI